MPLPQGFVLEPTSAPVQPKLPTGFVLEGQQPSPVLNQNSTPVDIPQLSQGQPMGVWDRLMNAGRTQLDPRSTIERLTQAPSMVEQMQPGVAKAIGEQVTLPNLAIGAVAGPVIKGLAAAGPAGKALLAYALTKLGTQGAEQAGQLAGQASAEQGKEQQYHAAQAGISALPALGLLGIPLARTPAPLPTGARPTTGLTTGDIADITEGRERIPIQRQLQAPTSFIGGSSAAPVIDIRQLSPNEIIEAQRLAQANATLQERQLADIASKKKFGGETQIIGGRPMQAPQREVYYPQEVKPSTEIQTQPKEVQGGQVSFSAPAQAAGVPSARQSAIENIRPAVRTMDNKVYIGEKGDSHNDIITKNSLSPTMIDRRAFVDARGNLISREDLAKQGVPGEPTSVPGAHSTGLKEVQQDPRLLDVERFNQLGKVFQSTEMGSPEFNAAWAEREQIKNKYGGMPPDSKEAIQYAENVRRNQGQSQAQGLQQQGGQTGSSSNVQQTPQEGSKAGGTLYGLEGPQKLYSGPDVEEAGKYAWAAGRSFVSQAEKILRDPQAIGFSTGAQVDVEQLKNRLRNKVGAESTEWKMMKDAGIEGLKGKMTSEQMAEWVKENGPKVEVRKFGEGATQTPEEKKNLDIVHQLDGLTGGLGENIVRKGQGELDEYIRGFAPQRQESIRQLYSQYNQNLYRGQEGSRSHWQSIAPKSESQMPGYVEIAVVKPTREVGKTGTGKSVPNAEDVKFPSSHSFPPNTLGFVRGYMETDPKTGEKTFHVIEVQSDWAQQRREFEAMAKERGGEESLYNKISDDELLKHYERLALKAAIDHAKKEGATRIAVSDAETAMMTEGHDRQRLTGFDENHNPVYNGPKQEQGMRLHYDQTLPKILGELTGEKGEKVEFGEHRMAKEYSNEVTPESSIEDIAARRLRKDLIFRTPSGEPKTSISARSFSIAKPSERLASGEPQTTTGKLYGGVPFLDPEFYTPLINDAKKLADKTAEGVGNLLEKGKITEAVSRKYDSIRGVSQRVADQLSNNIRGPLERTFGKKDSSLSEQALSLVRESKENKAFLQDQYNRRSELSGKPREKDWVKAAQFALSNWDKLVPISKRYQAYTDQVLTRLSEVDRPIEKRSGYVRHLPESSDNVTGFRRAREFDTFFDRIAAGSDPKSLNSVELLKSTIYDAHRSYIQSKAFNDWMTKVKTPSGKPLAMGVKDYEKIDRGPRRQPDVRPPKGYSEIAVGGQRIAVQDEYKGLLQRLTDTSFFDRRALGRALQQYAGLAKHVQFAIDLVHLGRMARIEMAAKGGTGNLPIPSYKKGILTLDYTPQELEAKAKAGEIDQKDLPEMLENRRINNKLVEGGFNVGHYADALRSNWVEKLPVSGQVQRFIFNVFTRGAMAEVGPITYKLYKKQYPNLTEEQVVGKVVHDLNYTFRNLGKQGPIKSASGDDLLRLFIAAPQWTIGTPMYEAQAIGGAAKGMLTGKFNIQSRTVGTMIAAYLVFNQIINYATTGHSTFENEKGHKIDAWVPVGDSGYWVGPEAAALETVNRIEQVANKSETALEGVKNYIDPKLSAIGKAVATAATGHEYGLTGPLLPKKDQAKAAAEHLAVVPIAASSAMKEGQLAPQAMRTLGLEGSPALSDRQKMYQLARQWMNKNKIDTDAGQFVESKYLPLTDALRKGDTQRAKELYEDLKSKMDDKLIRTYYKNYSNRGFTNSEKHEQDFIASLSSEQRVEYDKAKQGNDRVKETFFQMLGERAPSASEEKKGKGKRQKKFKLFGE